MEDKEQDSFQWTTLFFVTGFSFLLFSLAIKLLKGNYFREFLATALVSLSLGLIGWIGNKLLHADNKPGREKLSR